MTDFKKAQTLQEVAAQLTFEPLPPGDARYTDISAGRDSKELQQLQIHLTDASTAPDRFAKVAFTGHRGSGKSTELLRLEHDLSDRFTCLHLCVDESLLGDCDYTDLFLWLVDNLVRRFEQHGLRLDKRLVDDVSEWFAEKTLDNIKTVKSEITAEAQAEVETKAGFYFVALKLLARIKSAITGSTERRITIRRKLQDYSTELISRVNLLLDQAQTVLEGAGKPANLLIVQDNLDRLPFEAARRLFLDNGDLLKSLRAHMVYTVPIPMVLAPWNVGNIFDSLFTMPMPKVRDHRGRVFKPGRDALMQLLSAQIELESVFGDEEAAEHLVTMSGGSVRDLIRLVHYAQLAARTDGQTRIDLGSAKQAVRKLQLDYERLLVPMQVYMPLLARIHLGKQLALPAGETPDLGEVQRLREFFSQLLFNGSVLEYNGTRSWYDVHPAVRQIQAFKDALQEVQTAEPPR